MKLGIGIGLAGGIMAASLWSHAGATAGQEVTLSGSNGVYGSMAAVRAGSGYQYIGCQSYNFSTGPWAMCSAETATGTVKSCQTTDSSRISNIRSLGTDSELFFTWDSSADCAEILIETYSYYGPKQP